MGERGRIVNRMTAALVRLGIRGFNPNFRQRRGVIALRQFVRPPSSVLGEDAGNWLAQSFTRDRDAHVESGPLRLWRPGPGHISKDLSHNRTPATPRLFFLMRKSSQK